MSNFSLSTTSKRDRMRVVASAPVGVIGTCGFPIRGVYPILRTTAVAATHGGDIVIDGTAAVVVGCGCGFGGRFLGSAVLGKNVICGF